MDRFDFDEQDLAENRAGRLSERQVAQYRGKGLPWKMLATCLAVSGYMGWAAGSNGGEALIFNWKLGLGFGACVMAFLTLCVVGPWWRIHRQPLSTGLKSTSGQVRFFRFPTKFRSVPCIGVGPKRSGRHFLEQPGDRELFARIPRAKLYYNQGFATTHVHSIEPMPRRPKPSRRAATEPRVRPQDVKVRRSEEAVASADEHDSFLLELELADTLAASAWGSHWWGLHPMDPEKDYRLRAAAIYQQLLQRDASAEIKTRIGTSLGGVLCDAGRPDEAIEVLRPLISQPGADRNTHYNLFVALMNHSKEGRGEAPIHHERAQEFPKTKHTHQAFFDYHGH